MPGIKELLMKCGDYLYVLRGKDKQVMLRMSRLKSALQHNALIIVIISSSSITTTISSSSNIIIISSSSRDGVVAYVSRSVAVACLCAA